MTTQNIIGYRVWIVYIEHDGRPSLRSFHRGTVTRRWPYLGEGDAHFTMGRMIVGDTAGRSPEDQTLCTQNHLTLPGCRKGRSVPDNWTPAPCQIPNCPEDHPRITNTLGFHAFKTMQTLKESIQSEMSQHAMDVVWPQAIGYVIAEVILWGHIVEHDTGWRGEYSRPHRLLEFVRSRSDAPTDVIHQLECLYLDIEPMEDSQR